MKIKTIRYWILAADLLWMFAALCLGIYLRYKDAIHFAGYLQTYSLMILAGLALWTLLYFEMSLDGFKGGWQRFVVLSRLIVAVSLLMVVLLAFSFLTRHYYSRAVLLYFAFFFFLGLVGLRCIVHLLVTAKLRNLPENRCVILGHGPVARELASKIASHPEVPFEIVGFLFPGESGSFSGFGNSLEAPITSVKTLRVLDLLLKERVQKLIIALPQSYGAEIPKLISGCRRASIRVFLVPDSYDLYVSRTELMEIDGLPMLSLEERNPGTINIVLKRTMDLVLAFGILLLTSPILAVAALIVYSAKGRAFRFELRCGKDGVPFRMYRLDVDRHPTDQERRDRFLVRWSLTELPQLWNVLCGDMSLVGPRPESPERVKYYSEWQRERLKTRAGVTGLAQVHGLRDQHPSEDKARYDLQYIFNWSPLLDLSLILQTVWTVLFRGLTQEPNISHTTGLPGEPNDYVTREVPDVNRT